VRVSEAMRGRTAEESGLGEEAEECVTVTVARARGKLACYELVEVCSFPYPSLTNGRAAPPGAVLCGRDILPKLLFSLSLHFVSLRFMQSRVRFLETTSMSLNYGSARVSGALLARAIPSQRHPQ
jgi:hypothetical protein